MVINIPFHGKAFNGIISYFCLFEDPLSNYHIAIQSSSQNPEPSYGYAQSVLDGSHEIGWYSDNIAFSYINISFSMYPLLLTNYSLQSPYHPLNRHYPQSWKLKGKNINDSFWTTLDERNGQSVLVGNGKYSTFSCYSPQSFTQYQIQMTNYDTYGNTHYFGLRHIEFFGSIMNVDPVNLSSNCNCSPLLTIHPLILMFQVMFLLTILIPSYTSF